MEGEKGKEGRKEGISKVMGLKLGRERAGSVGSSSLEGNVGKRGNVEWSKRKRELTREELIGTGKKEKEEGERGVKKVQLSLDDYREGGGKLEREMREFMAEVKGDLVLLRKEREEMKLDFKAKEESWGKERREMKERIERLEEEVKMKGGREKGRGEEKKGVKGNSKGVMEGRREEEMEERMKRVERGIEREERERRKKNLIFKGVKEEKGEIKEILEKICLEIGVKAEIEEVKRIRTNKEERGQMVIAKIRSEEERKRILENKGKMKGKEIWIEEDLTFKERKLVWRIRRVMEEERRKGKAVRLGIRLGSRGLWIENKWWYWDEEEERMKEGGGFMKRMRVEKIREEEVREGREGKE